MGIESAPSEKDMRIDAKKNSEKGLLEIVEEAVDAVAKLHPELRIDNAEIEIRKVSLFPPKTRHREREGYTVFDLKIKRIGTSVSDVGDYNMGIDSDGTVTDEKGNDLGVRLTRAELSILGIRDEQSDRKKAA